jgi:hypothetical protein
MDRPHCGPTTTREHSRVPTAPAPREFGGEPGEDGAVVLVLHRAHLAVLDDREVGARAHRQDRPLGVDDRGEGGDLLDRADDVLHEVGDVAEQVAHGAAARELLLEAPRQRALGLGGVAVEEHRADVGDPAERAVGDQLAHVLDAGAWR